MKKSSSVFQNKTNRRSFLKSGTVAGAATLGAGLLPARVSAFERDDDDRAPIT